MYLPGMASPPGPKLTGLLTLPWYAEGTLKFSGGSQGSPDVTSSWSNASTRGRGTWPGTLLGLRPWASDIKHVPHNGHKKCFLAAHYFCIDPKRGTIQTSRA